MAGRENPVQKRVSLLFSQMFLLWITSEAIGCMGIITLITLSVPRSLLPTAQEGRPHSEGSGEGQVVGSEAQRVPSSVSSIPISHRVSAR